MNPSDSTLERRFLLASDPPGLEKGRGRSMQQGYLASDRGRDILVNKDGWRCEQIVRERRRRVHTTTRLAISHAQFETLWPLTEKCRIILTRHALKWKGLPLMVDVYAGDHAPLRLATIRFATRTAGEIWDKPSFLGEEITMREDYTAAHLATHGLPIPHDGTCQAGALPFLFKKRELHVVLVTSSSGNRWIVPKGQLEPRMTRQEVALMEAAEEAGVVGAIEPGHRHHCRLEDGRLMHLYPLRVFALLKHWPEAAARKRLVLPIREALAEVEDKALAGCIRRIAARLSA